MYSDIIILAMLANGPKHGYEIKKRVEYILGGSIALNNKVLYPTLKRFEEMQAVVREVVRQQGKPDRHLYDITEHGRELLQMLLQDSSAELLRHDAEFLVRVSMFQLIEPEARLEILRTRAEIINQKILHSRKMRKLAYENNADAFALEVLSFNEQQDQREFEWVQSLVDKM